MNSANTAAMVPVAAATMRQRTMRLLSAMTLGGSRGGGGGGGGISGRRNGAVCSVSGSFALMASHTAAGGSTPPASACSSPSRRSQWRTSAAKARSDAISAWASSRSAGSSVPSTYSAARVFGVSSSGASSGMRWESSRVMSRGTPESRPARAATMS